MLQIFNPCNENWDKMTPVQRGRFCDHCATPVMDFSVMTDQEILKTLAAANGSVCGRIHKDQLERALHNSENKKAKSWQLIIAGAASLLFSIGKSNAQKRVTQDAPKADLLTTHNNSGFLNAMEQPLKTIKGKILSTGQEALLNGYVVNTANHEKILANNKGQFVMQVTADAESVLVGASGYKSRVVPVALFNNRDTVIQLSTSDTTITGIGDMDKGTLTAVNIVMGGISSFNEVDRTDTVITFVKKIFNNAFFKIYPNPATKGGIGISVKQSGDYTVQIFDSNSKLVHVQEIVINDKGQVVQIIFPSCMVKGTYYIRIVDKKTKKQYTDKLIVQ